MRRSRNEGGEAHREAESGKERGIPKEHNRGLKVGQLFYVITKDCVWSVCMPGSCDGGEVKGPHYMSYTIAPHLSPSRQSLSLNLGLGWWPASPRDALVSSLLALGF